MSLLWLDQLNVSLSKIISFHQKKKISDSKLFNSSVYLYKNMILY